MPRADPEAEHPSDTRGLAIVGEQDDVSCPFVSTISSPTISLTVVKNGGYQVMELCLPTIALLRSLWKRQLLIQKFQRIEDAVCGLTL